MIKSPLAQKFVIIYVIISASSLYTANIFPASIRNVFQLSGIGLLIIYILIDLLFPSDKIKQNFKKEVYLFLVATFLSMFVANIDHNQDFGITLVAQRFMYFYLFYFVLHSFDLSVQDIERVIVPFGLVYAGLYILQYFSYPTELFDTRIERDRRTVRVFIPGASFLFLAYFKTLQEFLISRKNKHLILSILFFIVGGVLTGTRQSFATLTLVTGIFIFFLKGVKSRSLVIALAIITGFSIFLLFYDMFMGLVELTQSQSQIRGPNIRYLAARYFLTDFMQSDLAYILGNGMDSTRATYGQKMFFLMEVRGFYQSDIGIIGDYSKFGVLFVLAQLSFLVKMIFGKMPNKLAYVKYYFIALALSMFTGANAFGRVDGIVFICLIMYLIDREKSRVDTNFENTKTAVT